MVVSSMDTVSTQSKGSPTGTVSSRSWVRLRISGSNSLSMLGATAGWTVLRCSE